MHFFTFALLAIVTTSENAAIDCEDFRFSSKYLHVVGGAAPDVDKAHGAIGCIMPFDSDVQGFRPPKPLILSGDGTKMNFLYPEGNGDIKLSSGQKIFIVCPFKPNIISGVDRSNHIEVTVTCINGEFYQENNEKFVIRDFHCKENLYSMTRDTETKCYNDNKFKEIGFQLKNTFLPLIEICWNKERMMPYWSKHILSQKIRLPSTFSRHSIFWTGGENYENYNNCQLNGLYFENTQKLTLKTLLGEDAKALSRFDKSKHYRLNRGHLTPIEDFPHFAQKVATLNYINSAPQWETINGGNWNAVEIHFRNFAIYNKVDLEVYTGIHGQLHLANSKGVTIPIYLKPDGTKSKFPVPKYFWKIFYHRSTKRGIAIIILNDPFPPKEITICKKPSNALKSLKYTEKVSKLGFVNICSIPNLKKIDPSIPDLEVENPLDE